MLNLGCNILPLQDFHPRNSSTSDTSPLLAEHATNYSATTQDASTTDYPTNPQSEDDETRRLVSKDDSTNHEIKQIINEDRLDTNNDCAIYKRRWYILVAYWLMYFTQALSWNTWGPIALTSKRYYTIIIIPFCRVCCGDVNVYSVI